MALLSGSEQQQVREALAGLVHPVKLVFFTQTLNCETCELAKQILAELPPLSDKITVEEKNLLIDRDAALAYGVDRAPAVAVVTVPPAAADKKEKDTGIRFLGAPSGYEFTSLLEAVILAGKGSADGLSPQSLEAVASVTTPLHLQVFVTPT